MGILDADSFPEIRAALDVTLEEERLPDEIIMMGAYLGDAEREVALAVPGWADLTGDARERVRLAVVFKTAARIAPAMPVITREDRLAFSFNRQAVDWAAHAAHLQSRAGELLDVIAPPATSDMDTALGVIFTKASTRRGGY